VPLHYWVDEKRRLVVAKASGQMSDEDVFAYQREAWSRPELVGYAELVDMSEVERIDLPSIERIRDLAQMAADMDRDRGSSKLAIVATRDFAFGLARMYETYRDLQVGSTKQVGVFRTHREAMDFLGVEGDAAPPQSA
jgi:hypothetical protein